MLAEQKGRRWAGLSVSQGWLRTYGDWVVVVAAGIELSSDAVRFVFSALLDSS